MLHGVDDGSPDLAYSIAMLEMAAAAGTTDIVATPHASVEYPYNSELIGSRYRELSAKCPPGIRVHLGCDFHIQHDNIADALQNPKRYTVNGGRYLLIELSDLAIFKNTTSELAKLQAAGMALIVTHPERNPLLRQRIALLREWVAQGCWLQVTGDSLLGRWGSKAEEFARTLIDEGMCHFLASDAHGLQDRSPRLDEVQRHVTKRYGAECAKIWLETNPGAVIANEPGRLEAPRPVKKKRFGLF